MKFTKALKLIKQHCSEKNCCPGICPLAKRSKSDGCVCMIDVDIMDSWDVKEINRRVKLMGKGEKALKRGVLPSSVQVKECIKGHIRAH